MMSGETEERGAAEQHKTVLTRKGGWKRGDKIEITASRPNLWLFTTVVGEKERVESNGGLFSAAAFVTGLCRDGLAFRELQKKQSVTGKQKEVIPRLDRYLDEKFLGRNVAEALKAGHITMDDVVTIYENIVKLREEIQVKDPAFFRDVLNAQARRAMR